MLRPQLNLFGITAFFLSTKHSMECGVSPVKAMSPSITTHEKLNKVYVTTADNTRALDKREYLVIIMDNFC